MKMEISVQTYIVQSNKCGVKMVYEVDLGISVVNERCGTNYTNPDEVIEGAAKLAESMIEGEAVDYQFDSHIMAIDLFRAGGVMRPLRSNNMSLASRIWLSRN